MVGGADEGAGFDHLEAGLQPELLPFGKLLRGDPTVDREMPRGRLEVLPDGENGDSVPDEIPHRPGDLVLRLADPEHDTRLGGESAGARVAEDEPGAIIASLDPDGFLQAFDRLDVVIEDVGTGVEDGVEIAGPALQIGDENFDAAGRVEVADCADRPGPDGGPAVFEFIAGDGGDHAVAEFHPGDGFGHPCGFAEVDLGRPAGFDRAEAAGAGADIPEDHDGGGAARPAFPHVRALGALADRVQLVVVDQVAHLGIFGAGRQFGSEPGGFSLVHRL